MPAINKLLFEIDTELVATNLVSEINKALDTVAPFKTTQMRKHYAPHLDQLTKEMMIKRDELRQKMQTTKDDKDRELYKKIRNQVVKHQRRSKKEWTERIMNKEGDKNKNLWQLVKRVSGDGKNKSINKLVIDSIAKTNQVEIANHPAF